MLVDQEAKIFSNEGVKRGVRREISVLPEGWMTRVWSLASPATYSAASSVNPPAKTAKHRKSLLCVGSSKLVAPGDGIAHGAQPWRSVTRSADQQGQPPFQSSQQGGRRKELHPSGGRARSPMAVHRAASTISETASALSARSSAKLGSTACASLDEQPHGLRILDSWPSNDRDLHSVRGQRQGQHRKLALARQTQRRPARSQHRKLLTGNQQFADLRGASRTCSQLSNTSSTGSGAKSRGQPLNQRTALRLSHPNRLSDGRHDKIAIGQRREGDKRDLVRKIFDPSGSDFDRQAGLAHSPGTGQGEQPHIRETQEV